MLLQINTDNRVDGNESVIADLEDQVRARLSRYENRLTRVEIHVSDVNADKSGADDKRCMLEARPNGLAPVSVTSEAATVEQAVTGAAGKLLVVLERTFGKLTDRKGH